MLLPVVWAACAIAGLLYAHQQNIPQSTALAALPAFLLEATFYYALASDKIRARIERLAPATVASALTVAAVAPYLAASIALGSFQWRSALVLAALSVFVCFWYVFVPKTAFFDIFFLACTATVMLTHVFPHLYVSPHPKLPLSALGQAMWIRTGVFVMLAVRRVTGVGFGLWPDRRQWKIGVLYYLLFLIAAVGLAWWIGFAKPHWPPGSPNMTWERTSLYAVGTFFGALWVLALGEEFLFRGLLQQWIGKWIGSEIAGLLLASLLFGAVHLWFRGFPNWRLAIMAAFAGVFYGMAFRQTKSIRASMVTHALVVTTWRVFFW
jgi:membrane protease YdiL (CAAX protease family)